MALAHGLFSPAGRSARLMPPLSAVVSADALAPLCIVAAGGLLAALCSSWPAALPVWAPWNFSWIEFLAAAFGLWWYARGIAASTPSTRPGVWRRVSFALGVMLIYAVLQTRFDYMAQHMFFLNRTQHLVMHHLGPFLLALAWPGEMLGRGMPAPLRRIACDRRVLTVMYRVQQPMVAAVLFVGLIWLFLVPPVHFRAMLDARWYAIMNWSMVIDGILFWCLLLDPRPSPPARVSFAARMITAALVMFPQIIAGSYVTFATKDLYLFYDFCGRLFPSVGALNDQHLGGLIVWIPGSMMSAVAFMLVLNNLRRHEEAAPPAAMDEEARQMALLASRWTGR